MRFGDKGLGVAGVAAGQQPSLALGGNRHVPVHQECQSAEHPFLGDALGRGDHLADALDQVFVVGHGSSVACCRFTRRSFCRSLITG
ncbi:Uncharacterised protein [Mycobacteroides abscessus subsp. abscessus]|nr:Uncharacterised protein [Mycobacteroides abscessus subsp. abscessus]